MDDFTPEQLATIERFMTKNYPFLTEIVKLGQKIQYGQSNITMRWHEGKCTDVVRLTNFVRRKTETRYTNILDEWIKEVGNGQLNVTLQIEDGRVTDLVNAIAYERSQFKV